MRFDDRLLTVLNQPAEDRHDSAVRWRQLVDLVARAGANSTSPVVVQALEAIRSEAAGVEETLRAAAARAVAALPLPLGLLEYFASDTLAVSAPVLAAATLDPSQWAAIQTSADPETQRFIQTLHPDLKAEPHVEAVLEPKPLTPGAIEQLETPAPSSTSLHEVVERIERRRRQRLGSATDRVSQPAGEASIFRWECGPGGEIAWVEGAPRGPLIGRSLSRPQEGDGDRVDPDVIRAFAVRAPFRDAALNISGGGPVSGEWKISGVPAFEPADGRFAGYRGVALRETPVPEVPPQPVPELLSDPDSLRELVHEIKTPLNAIIGFAEIIEGQYLGPADRGYRDRASEIVRQARLLLTAIDDLDFAAKVHSARGAAPERVDLGALIVREAAELKAIAARSGAILEVVRPRFEVAAAVQPELADRLLFRLFSALAEQSASGEQLHLSAESAPDGPRITIDRPSALRGIGDTVLFDAKQSDDRPGGFSLKLVRGLARIAGGDLVPSRGSFALVFARA
ncbi:MAG TPA: histidine kinase dimerization/phospho-acceptor domain-containing protein [Sphingomicrobium sp.]